jgi:tetratricopeptide (TPR) repeat protein
MGKNMSDPWKHRASEYMEHKQWQKALVLWDLLIQQHPTEKLFYTERAHCLLGLRKWEEALRDYQYVYQLSSDNDYYPIMIGITLWGLRRFDEAITSWRQALMAKYTDLAGGVEAPAFLFFASIRLADNNLCREATARLRKRWKPRLQFLWPGPIAGYLLGKIPEQVFLITQTFADPILESRRRCKAHFWVAVKALQQQDFSKYRRHLKHAIRTPPKGHFYAVTLEPEYWLAQAEWELQAASS